MTEENEATTGGADGPVSTLRGASAAVDTRRATQVVVGVVLAALAVLGIVFVIVGINKNDQIDELQQHGVPVTFVVSKCLGELGGSGSNAAGYACQGNYEVGGRRYFQNLPGSTYHPPGARVRAITVPSDPTLLSIPAILDAEQSSSSVFILPAVLLGAFVVLLVVVVLRLRARRS